MKRLITAVALSAAGLMTAALPTTGTALAQATTVEAVTTGEELYQGERALYEQALKEGLVVSFDTGPTWANWAAEFAAFKKRYPGVEMTYNDLGSAATVVALDKARNRPQADTAYYFAASAFDAMAKDVVAPFKPVNFDTLPEVFRDADGKWFTIHSLTVAFVVNTKLVKEVPRSWADLLKPEYKNSVVYLDPRSTGIGQVISFAANFGNGGDMDNLQPGFDYFARLHKSGNVMRVEGTTPYAKFVKGEIPIWISYENDGLKAKHTDGLGDAVSVVIPAEASAAAPYGISLVKNGPNPNAGKLWLNFIMSAKGQAIFAEGYVRPSVPGVALPADIAAKLPPAPQVRPLDVKLAAERKAAVDAGWTKAALGK
ncbi:ABC transporter substrate-binding protein [Azospirillum sp. B510]|uniref:ABC transporter substrate-binding protein n=1 Tax=Azospirillum sp. (strain B510) TaxID=137722 RepID=UPI00031DFBCD|nr:ABC transporter substrate-binding protein [Azospirillum sp. B510]